ncbi:MAG: hypothetical protein LC745_02405, partial [Planctomycetia bacterium]|nr:hypothetical protein [Planctomycetia bacterium]
MDPTLRRNVIGVIVVLAIPAVAVWDPPFLPGGDARRVNRMLREAPGLIDRLPGNRYPYEAHAWFKALAKAGYPREARRMAGAVKRPDLKNQALAAVAAGLFEAQRMDEAATVARSIPDPKVRDQTLRMVSMGFALAGGVNASRGVVPRFFLGTADGRKSVGPAGEVRDATHRDMGLADAARTLRLMNDDGPAEDATRRIADPKARGEAQTSKAWTLALKGEPDRAIEAAAAIPDPVQRVSALANVAGVLAQRSGETGNPDEPLAIGGRVIARRALGVGAVEAAERAVKEAGRSKIDPGGSQAALADVLGKTRRFAEARKAAAAIDDPARRAEVLGGMARSLAEGGEAAEALEVAR